MRVDQKVLLINFKIVRSGRQKDISLDEFECQPDLTIKYRFSWALASEKLMSALFLDCYLYGHFETCR